MEFSLVKLFLYFKTSIKINKVVGQGGVSKLGFPRGVSGFARRLLFPFKKYFESSRNPSEKKSDPREPPAPSRVPPATLILCPSWLHESSAISRLTTGKLLPPTTVHLCEFLHLESRSETEKSVSFWSGVTGAPSPPLETVCLPSTDLLFSFVAFRVRKYEIGRVIYPFGFTHWGFQVVFFFFLKGGISLII